MEIRIFLLVILLPRFFCKPMETLYKYIDFYKPLSSRIEVMDYLEGPTRWAGDRVVKNSRAIVMNRRSSDYTFDSCLELLSDENPINKTVVFQIENAAVLQEIAPLFNLQHNFIILLLRVVAGPNFYQPPPFGLMDELTEYIQSLRISRAIRFGLGFMSRSRGGQVGYEENNFDDMQQAKALRVFRMNAVLIEYDLEILSKTDLDLIGNDELSYHHVLIRSESLSSEERTDVRDVKMVVSLKPDADWIFDVTDALRPRLVKDINGSGRPAISFLAILAAINALLFYV